MFLITSISLLKFDSSVYKRYIFFFKKDLTYNSDKGLLGPIYSSPWFIHYRGSMEIYKNNVIFGSGMKSFRKICKNYDYVLTDEEIRERNYRVCANHPHNIYIEVLTESGTFAFILFIFLILYVLYFSFKRKNFIDYFIFCLLLSFLFPFKPTGSLYSSITGTLFWFLVSLPIAFRNYNK